MVRSLLESSVLARSSGLRFALLFLGVCVLLASVPLWLGMADFDYRYAFDRTVENPTFHQETEAAPYRQLSSEDTRVVDAALDGRSFTFEDDSREFPRYVSRAGTYYRFDARRAIDWTNPSTLGPTLLGVLGLWVTVEAVQHERMSLGPRGY